MPRQPAIIVNDRLPFFFFKFEIEEGILLYSKTYYPQKLKKTLNLEKNKSFLFNFYVTIRIFRFRLQVEKFVLWH